MLKNQNNLIEHGKRFPFFVGQNGKFLTVHYWDPNSAGEKFAWSSNQSRTFYISQSDWIGGEGDIYKNRAKLSWTSYV